MELDFHLAPIFRRSLFCRVPARHIMNARRSAILPRLRATRDKRQCPVSPGVNIGRLRAEAADFSRAEASKLRRALRVTSPSFLSISADGVSQCAPDTSMPYDCDAAAVMSSLTPAFIPRRVGAPRHGPSHRCRIAAEGQLV